MIDNARDFLRGKLGHSFNPRHSQTQGTYRFDIQGAGSWRMKLDHGNMDLEESSEPAECTIRLSAQDFVDIVNGKRSYYTTFLQGRLIVEGDRALAAGTINFLRKAA